MMPTRQITRLFALFAAGLLSLSAPAADFVVMNLDDSGPGSLRQAVLDAEDNAESDNITFDDSLSGQIDLGDALRVTQDATITGFPEDPGRITIDGGGDDRIFDLDCNSGVAVVQIEGLTLTNGLSPAGGAILSQACELTLSDMVITNNAALAGLDDIDGGVGGGIAAAVGSVLSVQRSTISGNVAGADRDGVASSSSLGGGIAAFDSQVEILLSVISQNAAINVDPLSFNGGGGGGVAGLQSSLWIRQSAISGNLAGNRADVGDGIVYGYGGGVLLRCFGCPAGSAIDDSTIAGNLAGNSGISGPVNSRGGGVFSDTVISVANSTISGNVAGDLTGTSEDSSEGGGLAIFGFDGDPEVSSSTITGNRALGAAGTGGGIRVWEGPLNLHNTIVAANAASIGPDAKGSFGSAYSIIENQSDVVFKSGSAMAGSPNLGPLSDNGGPTETHAITNTSLAFNTGDPLDCAEIDQRGVERPQLGGCDIGAFELAIPEQTLTELFESLVEAGDLTGDGKGKSASNRLNAMGNKIAAIDAFIEQGDVEQACEDLASALRKTDGEKRPPDFVQGPGAAALAAAIEQAQENVCL